MITDSRVTKSHFVSNFVSLMLLISMLSTAQGQTLTLDFDSLPSNQGPDAARNIVISISKDPAGQNLRFSDAAFGNAPAPDCNIAEIAAGATVTINVTSDLYMSPVATSQSIFQSATTTDTDYDLSNNNPSVTGTSGGFSSCVEFDFTDMLLRAD